VILAIGMPVTLKSLLIDKDRFFLGTKNALKLISISEIDIYFI
jgi:hypothetical protein